jgi:hypothetical protein
VRSSPSCTTTITASKERSIPTIEPSSAAALAAAALELDPHAASTTHIVERLDGGNPYFLVVFGETNAPHAIAAVDALSGDVASSARFERQRKAWLSDAPTATALAQLPAPAVARLVWSPSRASLSPLYPLWEIAHGAQRVYIDRDGRRWDSLTPAGPG